VGKMETIKVIIQSMTSAQKRRADVYLDSGVVVFEDNKELSDVSSERRIGKTIYVEKNQPIIENKPELKIVEEIKLVEPEVKKEEKKKKWF
jgi:hypothetical protein